MKLHLPQLFLVAVIAAASYAQAVDYTTDSAGNKLYNVGQHEGNNTPSGDKYMWVSGSDLTLSNSDKLGIIQGETLYTGAMTGQVLEKWSQSGFSSAKKDSSSTGMVTKNVKINGTLTIGDTAQVVLGGQHRTSGLWGLGATDEYTGIIADKVVVNGGKNADGKFITNLSTWNASVNTLEVNSGIVAIHTNGNGNKGNSSIVVTDPSDSKQVRIKEFLNVNGGTVTIGNNSANTADRNANDDHCQVGFGNGKINDADYAQSTISQSWIKQGAGENATDSTLKIEGKSVSVGGLNIEQHKGTMSVSNENYHIIADNGITYDSQIIQYGDAKLTLGGILAENKYKDKVKDYTGFGDAEFHVTQHGNGEINLTNGIVFNYNSNETKEEHSSFTQNGSGTINLSGVFGRNDASSADKWAEVYFDITQNGAGGNINLNNGAIMSAGDIVQNAEAVLNLKGNAQMTAQSINQSAGSIVVAENARLEADVINAGIIIQSADENGEVNASIQASNVSLTNGSLTTKDNTVTNSGNLTADKIVLNSGVFVNEGSINAPNVFADAARIMLAGSDIDYTVVINGGEFQNYGSCNDSVLVDGGTLTLKDAVITGDVMVNSGTVNVLSDSTISSLTLNAESVFNVAEGAVVTLTETDGLIIENGATIVVTVSADVLENLVEREFTLFSGNVSGLTNANVVFTDGDAETEDKMANIVLGSTSGSIKVEGVVSVPEPTTATLSLLALAGLCARRRRR